jgi:hypothetical protein
MIYLLNSGDVIFLWSKLVLIGLYWLIVDVMWLLIFMSRNFSLCCRFSNTKDFLWNCIARTLWKPPPSAMDSVGWIQWMDPINSDLFPFSCGKLPLVRAIKIHTWLVSIYLVRLSPLCASAVFPVIVKAIWFLLCEHPGHASCDQRLTS